MVLKTGRLGPKPRIDMESARWIKSFLCFGTRRRVQSDQRGRGRPDQCDRGDWNDGLELPCWPCYRGLRDARQRRRRNGTDQWLPARLRRLGLQPIDGLQHARHGCRNAVQARRETQRADIPETNRAGPGSRSPASSSLTADTVGYNFVKIFPAPGCRYCSRAYSRQYDERVRFGTTVGPRYRRRLADGFRTTLCGGRTRPISIQGTIPSVVVSSVGTASMFDAVDFQHRPTSVENALVGVAPL